MRPARGERAVGFAATASQKLKVCPATAARFKSIATRFSCQQIFNSTFVRGRRTGECESSCGEREREATVPEDRIRLDNFQPVRHRARLERTGRCPLADGTFGSIGSPGGGSPSSKQN